MLLTFSVVLETPEETFFAVWQPVHAMTVLRRSREIFVFIVIGLASSYFKQNKSKQKKNQ
ncbi:hypothetical protein L291_2334 [Acinetobacter guillouiae MSP4-18]|nr:hypothetical protein L291_2334 [Acinetobacter guillouiae MSP4-18]